MSDWIGIIEDENGLRGWGLRDGQITGHATGLSAEDIQAQLGLAEVFIVTPSRTAQNIPAKLHPKGAFTDLADGNQRLPAPQRLQLLGFQATRPDWDGVVLVLTATHAYWCLLSARELVGFQAFLTPRLIAALSLPHRADTAALAETLSRPERIAAHLAQAEQTPNAQTGHLIGAEMGAARAWWLGQQVTVIGASDLAQSYAAGLSAQGVPAHTIEDPSPHGLIALREALG